MTRGAAEYALSIRLEAPYEEAISRITASLKEEAFGILTEIDVRATLKQKLGVDFRRYVILGACNTLLAHRAFQTDLRVGLLLPCNVVVYEDGEGSVVEIIDPISMLDVLEQPALEPIAAEAKAKLTTAIQRVAAPHLTGAT